MISLHLTHAEILPPGEPVTINGQIVRYSRVLWMGGAMNVPNPSNFKGQATDVMIEVELVAGAKSFSDRETKTTSLSIAQTVKGRAITSAKVSK
jgi:hypothetical protein